MSVYSKSTRASSKSTTGIEMGRKERNKRDEGLGMRERAYIKAWWIRNSTPPPSVMRMRPVTTTQQLGGGQDDVSGHP